MRTADMPTRRLSLALLFVLCLLRGAGAHAAAPPDSFAGVAKAVKPAVVNIFSTRLVRTQDPREEFFRRFFGETLPERLQRQQSLGSGFIVSSDGYIATNAHVVDQAEQIHVKLSNRDEYDAKLIGVDPKTDVALIKIKPHGELPTVHLGDSEDLEVGDWVIAIGNPFGLAATVTAGIVSAKGRVIGAGPYDDFIQTDASINPGNSGGPLINTRGEVVGVNSAIFSRSGGSIGIGFAIPVNLARHVIDELRQKGKVARGWLGVSVQDLTPALAQTFGLDHPRGALVVEVTPDGPGDHAGLTRGDVIVEYNGTLIEDSHQVPALVAESKVGDIAKVKILRNAEEQTLNMVIAEQPSERSARGERRPSGPEWGLSLTDLTPALARRFGIPAGVRGAMVRAVADGSPADQAGFEAGDVIRQVGQVPVTSARTCQQALDRAGDQVRLLIQRGPNVGYSVLSR